MVKEGGKKIMAGGNFDINVGKTRPGTYVNVKSKVAPIKVLDVT